MASSRICVAVRKRPISEGEKDVVLVQSPQVFVNEPKIKYDLTPYIEKHAFMYDEVFDERVGNRELYSRCCKPLIDTVFSQGNATCFAYGQTGSGKTHTMLGRGDEPGLYVCAASDIFQRARQAEYEVYASFYEIYGRKLFDLLNNRAKLVAREDGDKVINICGLTEHAVGNVQELFAIISEGSASRAAGSTSANADSSRSHAVLQMEVRVSKTQKTVGRISFIDLAGNERGADTFDCDRKTRMEGAEINKSLLALKECIRALGMGKSHVPFRGSVLTEVLRDSFLGNSRTTMIATISPTATHCENSLNTLRYTQRVKDLGGPTNVKGIEEDVLQRGKKGGGGGAAAKPAAKKKVGAIAKPDWIDDFALEEQQAQLAQAQQQQPQQQQAAQSPVIPAPAPKARATGGALPSGRNNNNAPPSKSKPTPRIAIKDPMLASIVQNNIDPVDADEATDDGSDDTGCEEEDDDEINVPIPSPPARGAAAPAAAAAAPVAEVKLKRKEVHQVKAAHAHVVSKISRAEEELIAQHRKHVDRKITGIKEELAAIRDLDEDNAVDAYVTKVTPVLVRQITELNKMIESLGKLQTMLKEEEYLSRTLTPAVGKGRKK